MRRWTQMREHARTLSFPEAGGRRNAEGAEGRRRGTRRGRWEELLGQREWASIPPGSDRFARANGVDKRALTFVSACPARV